MGFTTFVHRIKMLKDAQTIHQQASPPAVIMLLPPGTRLSQEVPCTVAKMESNSERGTAQMGHCITQPFIYNSDTLCMQ